MPRRYIEPYWVYYGPHNELLLKWEEDWEVVEKVIPDLQAALVIARQRSPNWVISILDDDGMEIRRFTPDAYLVPVPSDAKDNPFYLNVHPEGQEVQRFGPMSEAEFWVEDMEDELYQLNMSADPTFEEIGQLFRDRRMGLGLTQRSVASMSDMSPQYYSDIERGTARANQAVLRLIAKVLHSYFDGPLPPSPRRRQNPSSQPTEDEVDHYRFFHGVPPTETIDLENDVNGGMVLIGVGEDIGYGILNKHSSKDGWYVHDFGSNVKVYRRAKRGEQADKTWPPADRIQVTNLGYNLGFTYFVGGVDGKMKEVKGSKKKYLAVMPNRKTLLVVGPRGVEYLMEGGDMRVDDWIRD